MRLITFHSNSKAFVGGVAKLLFFQGQRTLKYLRHSAVATIRAATGGGRGARRGDPSPMHFFV